MNAYVSPEERQLVPTSRISYPEHYSDASHRQNGGLSALFGRARAYFQQRAVLAELSKLSDRELADIGLNRASLPAMVSRR